MATICGDNRFEIIAKAKEALIESTNIEDSPKEMAVLDNFLFRCWQMGWLDKYETEYSKDYFTGMKHIVSAINYEIDRMSTKNEQFMEKYVDNDYFRGIERGLKEAHYIVHKVLSMQLEVKEGETK